MNSPSRILVAALILAAGVARAAAPAYTVIDLGTLGGSMSLGQGLNSSGVVAGYAYTAAAAQHAAIYANGAWTDLAALATAWNGMPYAYGINDSGQVAGYGFTTGGKGHAFLYDGGVFTDLGPDANTNSYGVALNASGSVVGYLTVTSPSANHAFLYTTANGMVDLGTLGGLDSYANGINDSGVVVGYSTTASFEGHAFRYTPGGSLEDLGTLGGNYSYATAINASGAIVGYSRPLGVSGVHAARYSGGAWTDLGTLGGTNSHANGINASGAIVGDSDISGGGSHAFLFSGGALSDLNDLIDASSGWVLASANAINGSGRITGSGTINGQTHGFLLVPIATSSATSAPGPLPPAAPVVSLIGKKKFSTHAAKAVLKGATAGSVTSVTAKSGKKTLTAKGTAHWKLSVALKPGKNLVKIVAHGPGGDSAPVKAVIIRN
jgi:probable HAF family extracellular repeat protein